MSVIIPANPGFVLTNSAGDHPVLAWLIREGIDDKDIKVLPIIYGGIPEGGWSLHWPTEKTN